MPRRIQLFICFLLMGLSNPAQNINGSVFYTLTEQQGLTDNTINCFFQDSRGVMWMGTGYGLNSYDGSVVKNYHASPGGLPSGMINDLTEDESKTLWVATDNGIASYRLDDKTFHQYRFDTASQVLNRYYSIVSSGNNVYLATEQGLVVFDKSTHRFSRRQNDDDHGGNYIMKLLRDKKGQLWMATYNGVWMFDEQKNRFVNYYNHNSEPNFDGLVTTLCEDHNGDIWFGTWAYGIKRLMPEMHTAQSFQQFAGMNGNTISIAEQRNGDGTYSMWQGSVVCRLNINAQRFDYLQTGLGADAKPISSNRIFCDRDNMLWISTDKGIKIYNPARQYFRTVILSSFVPLTSQGIALYPMQNSFLLGGESGSSLIQFNDSVSVIRNLSSLGGSPAVMNIQRDAGGNFWLCSTNGLTVLDAAMTHARRFFHDDKVPFSLPKNFLNYALMKKNGEVWLLPWRKGFWKADITNNRFERVLTKNGDTLLPNANASKAIEDRNGIIWITDYVSGVFRYDPAAGKLDNPVAGGRYTNIWELDDRVWITNGWEISAIDIVSGKKQTWKLPEGKNKAVYDFVPDAKGYFWLATKSGLMSFSISTGEFKNFTEGDGLFSNNMEVSMARLSNGHIIAVGGTYATEFDPAIVHSQSKPLPLLFTGLWVDGKEKLFTGSSIGLAWNERNIVFNWALLNYANAAGNTYYYKLDGINSNWQSAGNTGQVSFNSLAPGKYTFHYKAATPDGIMSAEQTMRIIVHPPFWKTWWFIILSVLIISFFFFMAVRYISQRNLKERLLKLEKEQAVEKERNRISRDMHDDLGSGLTRIAILSEVVKTQPADAGKNIDKISETARSLVDNLDEMVWALNPQNDSLDKLLAYIAEYTHQYLEGTNIEPNVDLPASLSSVYIGEEKRRNIFMAVKEFLNNTVKHSGAKNLYLKATQSEGAFDLAISDDGRGMDVSALSGMGNGLKNMRQRIEDVGGTAGFASQPGKGASLHIHCPV